MADLKRLDHYIAHFTLGILITTGLPPTINSVPDKKGHQTKTAEDFLNSLVFSNKDTMVNLVNGQLGLWRIVIKSKAETFIVEVNVDNRKATTEHNSEKIVKLKNLAKNLTFEAPLSDFVFDMFSAVS